MMWTDWTAFLRRVIYRTPPEARVRVSTPLDILPYNRTLHQKLGNGEQVLRTSLRLTGPYLRRQWRQRCSVVRPRNATGSSFYALSHSCDPWRLTNSVRSFSPLLRVALRRYDDPDVDTLLRSRVRPHHCRSLRTHLGQDLCHFTDLDRSEWSCEHRGSWELPWIGFASMSSARVSPSAAELQRSTTISFTTAFLCYQAQIYPSCDFLPLMVSVS